MEPKPNKPYNSGPMLPDVPKPVMQPVPGPMGPQGEPGPAGESETLVPARYYAVPAHEYDVVKADPNKWEENEIVGVAAGGLAAFVAALLIFLPLSGVERQTSFSAGLTLFGAGIGYALRSVQKK